MRLIKRTDYLSINHIGNKCRDCADGSTKPSNICPIGDNYIAPRWQVWYSFQVLITKSKGYISRSRDVPSCTGLLNRPDNMDIMKSILSAAGFDASSGAGIIRDVDTFFSFGFHGIAVPTCTVIQGPQGVVKARASSGALFRDTLKAATRGVDLRGIKIGVLSNEVIIRAAAAFIESHKGIPVVFDPVFAAKNGISLITGKGISACRSLLFGKTTVLTPNADEASIITGKRIRTVDEAKNAAEQIFSLGPQAVVVKGGHLSGDPVDVFFDGTDFVLYEKKRFDAVIHGTGCSFSSTLICFLAAGHSVRDAFIATEGAFERLLGSRYRISEDGYFYVSTASRQGMREACGE